MKDQYFGDFGDYQKFSLLETLRDVAKLKVVVHWMKTANDSSSNGSKIKYLADEDNWKTYHQEIFAFLKGHIDARRRELSLYESSPYAKGITFINDHIEDPHNRARMLERIRLDTVSELVFFDPDNGIEVASTNKKSLHKYVLWSDIDTAFASGKSAMVYQHFSRQNRDVFTKEKLRELKKRIPNVRVFSLRVRHSVYFLICQKQHETRLIKALSAYTKTWKGFAIAGN